MSFPPFAQVRKIRCDALPEGCSHCINQSLDCYVTDRVTGRTERRGYLQQLEREKRDMLAHIRDLEKLLQGNGIEVRPWHWSPFPQTLPPNPSFDSMGNPVHDSESKDRWAKVGSVWIKNPGQSPTPAKSFPSGPKSMAFRTRPTEGFLGLSSDTAPLSSISGTTLSILGTTIDLTSFDCPENDGPAPGSPPGAPFYNKSVMSFLQSSTNINPPPDNVDLPSRSDAFTYSEWYFLMIQPFLPMLHKPAFMKLVCLLSPAPTCVFP
jgi:hypothetical protein